MIQVDFSISQSSDGSTLTITDITPYAGADGPSNISSRVITANLSDGGPLPGYNVSIPFPVVAGHGDILTLNISKDYAITLSEVVTPVAAQGGSVYAMVHSAATLQYSKAKMYDRETRSELEIVECSDSYDQVNYTILRYIDSAYQRGYRGDLTGSQKLLDKISNITVKDCYC